MDNNKPEELIAEKITKPYNDAWRVIKLVLNDNSDEAWTKYVEEIGKFHDKLSGAKSPREFGYLKALYMAIDNAGEIIGKIQSTSKDKEGSN